MGAMLFSINPILAFIQRFVPRLLDGICLGYIYKAMRKKTNVYVSCAVTGFFSAFLNTLFFMTALVGLFGNTEYVQGLMGGRNADDRLLYDGRHQCSLRNGFIHSDHRSSRCGTFQSTPDPGTESSRQ